MAMKTTWCGRILCVTVLCGVMGLAALLFASPSPAAELDSTMPATIEGEYRKVRTYYREIKSRLDDVENELLALSKQTGAEVEAKKQELLAKRQWFIGHAETMKVEMDYLAERLKEAQKEYRAK